MYFDTKSVAGTVEILASNDYQAVPLKLDETGKVLAGMPITNAGKKAPSGSGAIGILLYDVDCDRNPNSAIVVDGIIDWAKVKAHNSDVTADVETIAAAMPNIVFREVGGEDGDGKTYVGG